MQITLKYRFTKKERLKSEIQISRLFQEGKSRSSGCLRMTYLFVDEELPLKAQVMFSVPKRNFKSAVKRNLLKRRMREVYRLNKPIIQLNRSTLLAFVYIDKEVQTYSVIDCSLRHLIKFLLSRILADEKNI